MLVAEGRVCGPSSVKVVGQKQRERPDKTSERPLDYLPTFSSGQDTRVRYAHSPLRPMHGGKVWWASWKLVKPY